MARTCSDHAPQVWSTVVPCAAPAAAASQPERGGCRRLGCFCCCCRRHCISCASAAAWPAAERCAAAGGRRLSAPFAALPARRHRERRRVFCLPVRGEVIKCRHEPGRPARGGVAPQEGRARRAAGVAPFAARRRAVTSEGRRIALWREPQWARIGGKGVCNGGADAAGGPRVPPGSLRLPQGGRLRARQAARQCSVFAPTEASESRGGGAAAARALPLLGFCSAASAFADRAQMWAGQCV
jgi:hypothetical protein